MVRFKNRWVLFQIVQDPVIEHGQVVYPRTAFEVTDSMISKTIFQSIELNYGHFGKGQGSVSGNCHAVYCARKGLYSDSMICSQMVQCYHTHWHIANSTRFH